MKTKVIRRITDSTLLLKFALVAMSAFILFICILISPVLIDTEAGAFRLFVVGLYIASVPYHYALYQAWLLLGYIEKNQAFTEQSVQSLKRIKLCAMIIAGLFVLYSPYILNLAQMDDAPGLFAGGLIITFLSLVIGVFTALLEKLFQNAVDIKAENDLTV
jgi:hypothetical protein